MDFATQTAGGASIAPFSTYNHPKPPPPPSPPPPAPGSVYSELRRRTPGGEPITQRDLDCRQRRDVERKRGRHSSPHRRGGGRGGRGRRFVTVPTIAFERAGDSLPICAGPTDTFNSTITEHRFGGERPANAVPSVGLARSCSPAPTVTPAPPRSTAARLSLGGVTAIPERRRGGLVRRTRPGAASSRPAAARSASSLAARSRSPPTAWSRLRGHRSRSFSATPAQHAITLGGTNSKHLLTVAGGSGASFADQIINGTTAGNLSKLGAGTLYLTDTNGALASTFYTGQTTVGKAIVNVQTAAGFGTAVVVVANRFAVQVQAGQARESRSPGPSSSTAPAPPETVRWRACSAPTRGRGASPSMR